MPYDATVTIDGHKIAVTSLDLHIDCESIPRLTISLPVLDSDGVTATAEVLLDSETAKAIAGTSWIDASKIRGYVIDGMPGIVHPHDVKILSGEHE